jgi:hypothetical protein
MPSRDIADLDEGLRAKWLAIKAETERVHTAPHWALIVTCAYRSPAEQLRDFACGRTVDAGGEWTVTDPAKVITNCDGHAVLSNHNHHPARALDFAITIAGKITWDEACYREVGERAEALGLRWGGRWRRPHDSCHLELPDNAS